MGREGLPPLLRALVDVLLCLYPRAFREEWGRAYREAAAHRWRRERAAERGYAAFIRLLLVDAARELPVAWRGANDGGITRGGDMTRWIESCAWDARVALRSLGRRPGLTVLVVGTLALGMGANAAIFGVLDRVVLRPFPFAGGDRTAYVMDRNVERGFSVSPSQEEVDAWREQARTVERMEVIQGGSGTLQRDEGAERVSVMGVSGGLADMIRLTPVVGRALGPADAEPDAPEAVMLAEDFWRTSFGADPEVVGRTLTFQDRPVTVVGVWPRDVRLVMDAPPELYRTLPRGEEADRSSFSMVLARLRPGVSQGDVEAELAQIQARVLEAAGKTLDGWRPSLTAPNDYLGLAFQRGLWILFAGVGLLLVVAAANAANLLLNRAVDREGELGVRLALGSGRGRLVRAFILEGAILGATGAGLGLLVAWQGGAAMAPLAPDDVPASLLGGVGGWVPAYTVLLVAGVTLVCGLVPALHLRSPRIRWMLGSGGGGRTERGLLRSTLISAQVTLAVILLVGGALTLRSLRALTSVDAGFALAETVTLTTRMPASRYPTDADRAAFRDRIGAAMARVPGVVGIDASGTSLLHYSIYSISGGEPRLEGDDREISSEGWTAVASAEEDFFDVLGIPVLEGRTFTEGDRAEARPSVAIVNRTFADRYPEGVVGRVLRFPDDTVRYQVVGVVGDVKSLGLRDERGTVQVYRPERRWSKVSDFARFNLRVNGDPDRVLAEVLRRVAAVDPALPPPAGHTGVQTIRDETADERFLALLLGVFGALSLVLAVAGVYGAISLHVARRTRELGIRIALGADGGRVVRTVMGEGMRPVMLGTAVGAAAAAVLVRYLKAVLYDVSPVDPVSFAAAAAVLLVAAAAALLLPARRATRVPPSDALRSE